MLTFEFMIQINNIQILLLMFTEVRCSVTPCSFVARYHSFGQKTLFRFS
jgi:hypothetical protein